MTEYKTETQKIEVASKLICDRCKAEEIMHTVSNPHDSIGAYRVKRRFHMWGRWLRYSSLYPTWVVRLVHKDRVRYINRGHAETQTINGEIGELQNDLIDENLKGVDEWFARQGAQGNGTRFNGRAAHIL